MQPLYQRADFPSYRMNRKSFESRVIYPAKGQYVEALGYLLAACLAEFDLELHAGCFNYNHDHLDVGHPWHDDATVAPRFADFNQRFRFLWWRVLRANENWTGPVYSRMERTHQGPVLDAEEFWRVATYDTAQAVKAGLFARTFNDPSLVFLPGDVLQPRTFTRNYLIDAIDPDKQLFKEKTVSIQLGIPRIFSHLSREDYAKAFADQLEDYEDEVGHDRVYRVETARRNCRRHRIGTPIGADTHKTRGKPGRQKTLTRKPAYTSKPEIRTAFRKEESVFQEAHKACVLAMRNENEKVSFPAGTYGWRRLLELSVLPPPTTCWEGQPLWWPE